MSRTLLGLAVWLCAGCGGPASTSEPAPAPAPAPAAAPAPAPGFHCFAWVHGPDFSTDCFATAAECEAGRKEMQAGARDPAECRQEPHASCTTVSRDGKVGPERCFGDADNCARYSAYVRGNGLQTTPCVDR